MRIGHGYDVHQLVEDRRLILGGVDIPHPLGLAGHSDADVVLHALCDAILGALSLGDIGQHFPDTDPKFQSIDSRLLLGNVVEQMRQHDYVVGNADISIIAQAPKMAPFIAQMRANICHDLDCELSAINVKATTTEQLGFAGREEGIACHAVVLLIKN